ncbi:hypothetical protein BU17DRAFT_62393 [Hysterangium stoloniferum]|nr:hypothetical protein BU17DRAFT_62393 [Hysterangium stoloniferum]
MEGSHHSSAADDRPLLPTHNTPGQYQQPVSPTADPDPFTSSRDSRRVISGDTHQEVDIAEHHQIPAQYDSINSPRRRNTVGKGVSVENDAQALDWIVPVHNGMAEREIFNTVKERLDTTLKVAQEEQLKYAKRAYQADLAINVATFVQIASNAIITGLSASTSNRHVNSDTNYSKNAQIGVSAMGAINTVISSFLVRVRGTREPERSKTHAENLEKFIRQLNSFILDEGNSRDRKWDDEVTRYRSEFDRLQTAVHQ